jgi:hypothetical protein
VERVRYLLAFVLIGLGHAAVAEGQMVGTCPASPERPAQSLLRVEGVFVDATIAVIPNVKLTLQKRRGQTFVDIDSLSTGADGKFDFGKRRPGLYRLAFAPPVGFCRMAIPIRLSNRGWNGIRVTVPVGATDTCPQYCEDRLRLDAVD